LSLRRLYATVSRNLIVLACFGLVMLMLSRVDGLLKLRRR
jgi:hypothetical protein